MRAMVGVVGMTISFGQSVRHGRGRETRKSAAARLLSGASSSQPVFGSVDEVEFGVRQIERGAGIAAQQKRDGRMPRCGLPQKQLNSSDANVAARSAVIGHR